MGKTFEAEIKHYALVMRFHKRNKRLLDLEIQYYKRKNSSYPSGIPIIDPDDYDRLASEILYNKTRINGKKHSFSRDIETAYVFRKGVFGSDYTKACERRNFSTSYLKPFKQYD